MFSWQTGPAVALVGAGAARRCCLPHRLCYLTLVYSPKLELSSTTCWGPTLPLSHRGHDLQSRPQNAVMLQDAGPAGPSCSHALCGCLRWRLASTFATAVAAAFVAGIVAASACRLQGLRSLKSHISHIR